MNVAVEGCCHGELDKIYERIRSYELKNSTKVDILLCCGDFQAIRHEDDLSELSCPPKYRDYRDFKDYYNGLKVSPVLTVFIGGNHEAPDFLRNLYFGGWVAPNIYYLGHSGVLNFGGLRISGISGIYNLNDYTKGYFESRPYTEQTKRSSYHIREFDVKKLSLIKDKVDIFLSHDWPAGIENSGNLDQLLRIKPFFYEDIKNNTLGNPKSRELMEKIKPKFWFSAHLHVKYEAEYKHEDGSTTQFLALDKVLPYREFLRIIQITPDDSSNKRKLDETSEPVEDTLKLCYDREWCAILVANRDKMPLNQFSSVNPITLNEPLDEDYKFVDQRFSESGYETVTQDGKTLFVIPFKADSHKEPESQREAFMNLLKLPTNNYFSPGTHDKMTVNFVE
ncbi:Lariat debranching enzyme A [Theileria parva strain Muguga]|uniref:RNA lariat debranching enzyme, putative n=1 Tax=Theileria parva TaxID=5875 RepID=Q4N4U2_THEPA|nr:Lariat debranching enzyme A [Theileria parva strain Muguga]EAN32831.1 Lariat debranching enzyme A [Theileria parva strain Muguga]|eukprot:XP_765114.1 RNA lariat debranching enzyme [Theileria parva strain Muguga]